MILKINSTRGHTGSLLVITIVVAVTYTMKPIKRQSIDNRHMMLSIF